ncbi:MAG: acetyl-CoA carboxylase biotin carboxyl carrier protein [Pseudomonadota bacterium]
MSNGKSKLDAGLVRELAAILREADLSEIEVEHDGLRVRVSKPAAAPIATFAQPAPVATMPASAAAIAAPTGMNTETDIPKSDTTVAPANAVTAPMVGTVYLSPEPGSAAFVKVGDTVAKGDTLMLVEAMKTFNPVDAPRAGKIKSILVEDGQPVEYGEALIVVE